MKLRRALLISYHYPPMGGSGVQRAAKLAAYLPQAGWQTHVLCAGHQHYPILDRSLVDPAIEAFVHRVPGFDSGGLAARLARRRRFFAAHEDRICWRLEQLCERIPLPEPQWLWSPAAIGAARRIIAENDIEAIITTSPPHSVHSIGRRLSRRLGIPWIADLRDPLLDNFGYAPKSAWHDHFWRRLEARIIHEADGVIVTCEDLREKLIGRYGLDAKNISVIHNGYDPSDQPVAADDLAGRSQSETPEPDEPPIYTISHVGSFYGQQSVTPVLEALRNLTRVPENELQFRQIGSVSAAQQNLILPHDRRFLKQVPYLPHRAAIREMNRAVALLLMTPAHPGGRFCIPAKTFEYLAFGRHIIAITHPGSELSVILHKAGNTTVIEDHSPLKLARAIEQCHYQWRSETLQTPRDQTYVARFRRDRQARKFAAILNRCTEKTSAALPKSRTIQSPHPCLQGVA